MTVTVTEPVRHGERIAFGDDILQPIDSNPAGKNFLSIAQLQTPEDFEYYNREAAAAEKLTEVSKYVLSGRNVVKIVMKQPSTRTGGSMQTATHNLGGSPDLYSGMSASSESKGETWADTAVAFSTQCDLLATRTPDDFGPMFAAEAIAESRRNGKLKKAVPVINLGDGWNEHPTQTASDIYTINKHHTGLSGLKLAIVGDLERYRANHSLMRAAGVLGMYVVTVESPAAPTPQYLVDALGDRLERRDENELDEAMRWADVLYVGRNPDEYGGEDPEEKARSEKLAAAYQKWIVDYGRLQIMDPDSIVLHPRPRRDELHPSVDADPRMKDVEQMENLTPMRMAIIAGTFGKSIVETVAKL